MAACAVKWNNIWSWREMRISFFGCFAHPKKVRLTKLDVARKWKVAKYGQMWQNDRNGEGFVSNHFDVGNFCNAINSLSNLIFFAPRGLAPKKTNRKCFFTNKKISYRQHDLFSIRKGQLIWIQCRCLTLYWYHRYLLSLRLWCHFRVYLSRDMQVSCGP